MFYLVDIATLVLTPILSLVCLPISTIPFLAPPGTQLQVQIVLLQQENSACPAQLTV